jgi:hypothetical protein
MKTIITTYPSFQTLPRGVKQLLVASEAFFFQDAVSPSAAECGVPKFPLWQLATDFRKQWGGEIMTRTG